MQGMQMVADEDRTGLPVKVATRDRLKRFKRMVEGEGRAETWDELLLRLAEHAEKHAAS